MRTLAQFQRSDMSPWLFQGFIDGYIKPLDYVAVEHTVVVMTTVPNDDPRFSPVWPVFDFRFIKFVFRTSGGIKF